MSEKLASVETLLIERDTWAARYAIGQESARRGKSKDACPFKSDDARDAWLAGWSSIRER